MPSCCTTSGEKKDEKIIQFTFFSSSSFFFAALQRSVRKSCSPKDISTWKTTERFGGKCWHYHHVCNHLNGCDVYSTWNVPPILPFLSHVSYPLLFRKNGWTTYQMENPNLFWRTAGETSRHDKSSERSFPHLLLLCTLLHPDKNAILHELTGSYFYSLESSLHWQCHVFENVAILHSGHFWL